MVCPACGSSSEATPICPGCGTELPVDERARPAVEVVASWADEAVDPAAARCPKHPELLASATCSRCGRFVCVTCAPASLTRPKVECDDCVARERLAQTPRRLARYRVELVVSMATMALFISAVPGTLFLAERSRVTLGLVVMAAPVTLGLAIVATLFGLARRRLFAWIGVVLEALVVVPLFFLSPSVCTGVLVAVPIYTVVRVLQVAELEQQPPLLLGRGSG